MAIIELTSGGLWIPQPIFGGQGAVQLNDRELSSGGEVQFGMILQAPRTGNIDRLAVRIRGVTGTPTGELRLETVGTDGKPTGTLWDTDTNGTFSPTADTVSEVTLTAPAAITRQERFAFVISGQGAYTYKVGGLVEGYAGAMRDITYGMHKYGANWYRDTGTRFCVGVRYDDEVWACLGEGILTPSGWSSATSYGATTTRALRFKLPWAFRLRGCAAQHVRATTIDGNDHEWILYADDGTQLAALGGIDTAQNKDVSDGAYIFDADFDGDADTYYKLALVKSGAATGAFWEWDFPSAAYLDQLPGGQNFHLSSLAGGTWTNTLTTRPAVSLWLSGL